MAETDPCEICNVTAETFSSGGRDSVHQLCPRCGEFKLLGNGCVITRSAFPEDRVKLSGWVRDRNMLGEVPELTSDQIKRIFATQIPGIVERADRFLTFVIRHQPNLGQAFNTENLAFQAVTYSRDFGEFDYLFRFLREEGFIRTVVASTAEVTPKGHMRHEEQQASRVASAQGFVAMWFDPSMQLAYANGLEAGIRGAGYDPLRIDHVDHVGKIDDEIIAQIRRSRFIVADFTGQRSGVYFEAGFALGLNLPVFWTCRQDDIAKLHFDIRQFNCIDWIESAELADRLQKRIEAVIGAGPRKPLPN